MFKAVITEKHIIMEGTRVELLAGLACYIDALKENNVPKEVIEGTVEIALKDRLKMFD